MANPADPDIPIHGRALTVWYAARSNGKQEAAIFYKGLPRKERAKMASRLVQLADVGPMKNDQMFKRLDDGIYEIKTPGYRLLCFALGPDYVLTHGCKKLPKKKFQREIERARAIRQEHLETFND